MKWLTCRDIAATVPVSVCMLGLNIGWGGVVDELTSTLVMNVLIAEKSPLEPILGKWMQFSLQLALFLVLLFLCPQPLN